jgi:hypothetical protein
MVPQSVADILQNHVKLSVEGIDRMYLNVYVPRLQSEGGIVQFFREHERNPMAGMLRDAASPWSRSGPSAASMARRAEP